ncbi:MAG: hydantoinase/oxoprolinase family protein [Armatimonadetes bacterium]|nr:hydantoinase/oxoprolinase family protein [Armatimonadota bacterium]
MNPSPGSAASLELGIDIGGTFTDFAAWDATSGRLYVEKVLTTPDAPSRAVTEGLAVLLDRLGLGGDALSLVIHGTTLITNALIERRGAKTALLTTGGHRDVLEIGTEMRYDTYDLRLERPAPLVPRSLRVDVPERLDRDGAVLVPLDRDRLVAIADRLAREDVEAVAICFLHAFRNPAHEREAGEMVAARLPGASVSLSSDVCPEIREYVRMSTTVANAYVQPATSRYVREMSRDLAAMGYGQPVFYMLSHGGIGTKETVVRWPIRVIESGPAAGALASGFLGRVLDRPRLLSFDMGGTTAKICMVDDGVPAVAPEFEVGRVQRFKPASGLPIRVPAIEMIEIGAGGGSVAAVDRMGLLKVGPRSAGARPGPACYGFGGTEATVTDADLLLGYLDAERFLGGAMRLDRAAARQAVGAVAARLRTSEAEAARGIFDVVNESMVAAAKVHIAERGRDPRRYTLVAFGGAGPTHAHAVARALKIDEILCPARAGVLSALGFLVAPAAFEAARALVGVLSPGHAARMRQVFTELAEEGEGILRSAGVEAANVTFEWSADMRYVGQGREITVPLGADLDAATDPARVRERFLARYRATYGYAQEDLALQVIACRLVARGPVPDVRLPESPEDPASTERARRGARPAYFPEMGGFAECPVYAREDLCAGARIAGPAIVEERESTAIVAPGMRAEIDRFHNLWMRFE